MNEEVIFHEARALASPDERAAYLDRACAGNTALKAMVEELLAEDARTSGLLPLVPDTNFPSNLRPRLSAEDFRRPAANSSVGMGTTIGHYTLLGRIAEGGMGSVWKAQQNEPVRRSVALKLIKAGLESDSMLARFEQERQALAVMDHPNIARVYDAGKSDDGWPYFVMELIAGVPITPYCDEHKLTLRQRLELFVTVCEAVQHAHQKGIIHRDLKPSNVLVTECDGKPMPKVIDFGIAKATGPQITGETAHTGEGVVVGTIEYMSPEQASLNQLDVDTRSDVYSLGVLLYELLTGTTPLDRDRLKDTALLELLRTIREGETPCPSAKLSRAAELATVAASRGVTGKRLKAEVRGELDWIVMRALEKDRARRYETATAFAADVGRYLRDEPVQAGPPSMLYRARKFVRRNAWPVAMAALLVVALGGLTWGSIRAAHIKAAEAEERERVKIREVLIQKLMQIRLGSHPMGWAEECRNLTYQAAKIHKDAELRDQYAATLAGMDARIDRTFPHTAYNVAWSKDGKQLLMGGWDKEPARLWNGGDDAPVASRKVGPGPAAFRPDGTAVQVVFEDSLTYRLWDMKKQGTIHELKLPLEKGEKADAKGVPSMAIADDASYVAASPTTAEGKGVVAVWDATTGKLVHRFVGKATALAFTPAAKGQGMFVAAGYEDGKVKVWSVAEGKEVLDLQVTRLPVYAIAFGRDPVRRAMKPEGPLAGWLLAAGGSGGHLSIWSLDPLVQQSTLKGSTWGVYALAFSPDSAILASAGRDRILLFDVARGRELLDISGSNYAQSVAFSRDGSRLAVSNALNTPRVRIIEIERDRGIKTLVGLQAPIAHVELSRDGKLLAALSHQWQVGVWNLAQNRLLHVFDASIGYWADNAAMVFSPDGSRLAFSTGKEAKVWNLATGNAENTITLPPGLQDHLAYAGDDKLWLLRVETEKMKVAPFGGVDPRDHPRVVRVRNLKGTKPEAPVRQFKEMPLHVFMCSLAGDGGYCTIEGIDAAKNRVIAGYDITTGKRTWSLGSTRNQNSGPLHINDPDGKFVIVFTAEGDRNSVLDVATGRLVQTLDKFPRGLGPGAKLGAVILESGIGLWPVGQKESVVQFTFGERSWNRPLKFDTGGTLLAWGHEDGGVSIADIAKVRTALNKIGLSLDW